MGLDRLPGGAPVTPGVSCEQEPCMGQSPDPRINRSGGAVDSTTLSAGTLPREEYPLHPRCTCPGPHYSRVTRSAIMTVSLVASQRIFAHGYGLQPRAAVVVESTPRPEPIGKTISCLQQCPPRPRRSAMADKENLLLSKAFRGRANASSPEMWSRAMRMPLACLPLSCPVRASLLKIRIYPRFRSGRPGYERRCRSACAVMSAIACRSRVVGRFHGTSTKEECGSLLAGGRQHTRPCHPTTGTRWRSREARSRGHFSCRRTVSRCDLRTTHAASPPPADSGSATTPARDRCRWLGSAVFFWAAGHVDGIHCTNGGSMERRPTALGEAPRRCTPLRYRLHGRAAPPAFTATAAAGRGMWCRAVDAVQ